MHIPYFGHLKKDYNSFCWANFGSIFYEKLIINIGFRQIMEFCIHLTMIQACLPSKWLLVNCSVKKNEQVWKTLIRKEKKTVAKMVK